MSDVCVHLRSAVCVLVVEDFCVSPCLALAVTLAAWRRMKNDDDNHLPM